MQTESVGFDPKVGKELVRGAGHGFEHDISRIGTHAHFGLFLVYLIFTWLAHKRILHRTFCFREREVV